MDRAEQWREARDWSTSRKRQEIQGHRKMDSGQRKRVPCGQISSDKAWSCTRKKMEPSGLDSTRSQSRNGVGICTCHFTTQTACWPSSFSGRDQSIRECAPSTRAWQIEPTGLPSAGKTGEDTRRKPKGNHENQASWTMDCADKHWGTRSSLTASAAEKEIIPKFYGVSQQRRRSYRLSA